MRETIYNKLVRDCIPEIIASDGKTCVCETLSDEDYLRLLDAKLTEELSEYQESRSLEELADLLEREVVTAISGKANGLIEASAEDTVISEATVPAAAIKVGYLTNGQESILLQREDYIQRIAEGIYQTILKAYEE